MNRDLGSRTEIEQTLDTRLDNVFSEEPAEAAARAAQDAAPTAYTEWGGGASNDDDYNLEAFVAAEVTLGEPSRRAARGGLHRAGAAHDRAISDRSGRRRRLSAAGSGPGRRAARRLASGCRGGARGAAEIRSARRLRAQSERVPGDPAARTQPLRPGDAGAGRASRSAGQARHRVACARSAASTTRTSPT